MRPSVCAAATLMSLAACAAPPETAEQASARMASESAAAKVIIDSLTVIFDAAMSNGMADEVAGIYTEDAVLAVPYNPVAKGRAAIGAMTKGLAGVKAALKTKATSVVANGPLAIEYGEYTLSLVPPGAPSAVTESGTYLIHWRKVGDHWLRVADVATSPAPIPPAPAK